MSLTINKNLLLVSFIFFGRCFLATAQEYQQQYSFQHLNVDNGLSHNYINSIIQDSQGFIWIGTQYGLQRFDGQKLVTFLHDPTDSNSIAGNNITFIEIDQDNKILIGFEGDNSFDKFDPATEKFVHQKPDFPFFKMEVKQDGDIWVGNNHRLGRKAKETDTYSTHLYPTHPRLSRNHVTQIYRLFEDKNQTVWAGTKKGAYHVGKAKSSGEWLLPCDDRFFSADTSFHVSDFLEDPRRETLVCHSTRAFCTI